MQLTVEASEFRNYGKSIYISRTIGRQAVSTQQTFNTSEDMITMCIAAVSL